MQPGMQPAARAMTHKGVLAQRGGAAAGDAETLEGCAARILAGLRSLAVVASTGAGAARLRGDAGARELLGGLVRGKAALLAPAQQRELDALLVKGSKVRARCSARPGLLIMGFCCAAAATAAESHVHIACSVTASLDDKLAVLCGRPLRIFWQRRVWVTLLQRGPLHTCSRRLQPQLCLLWVLAAVLYRRLH